MEGLCDRAGTLGRNGCLKKKGGGLNVYLLLTRRTYLVYRDYQNCEERDKNLDEEFCVVITSIYSLRMMWVRRK